MKTCEAEGLTFSGEGVEINQVLEVCGKDVLGEDMEPTSLAKAKEDHKSSIESSGIERSIFSPSSAVECSDINEGEIGGIEAFFHLTDVLRLDENSFVSLKIAFKFNSEREVLCPKIYDGRNIRRCIRN